MSKRRGPKIKKIGGRSAYQRRRARVARSRRQLRYRSFTAAQTAALDATLATLKGEVDTGFWQEAVKRAGKQAHLLIYIRGRTIGNHEMARRRRLYAELDQRWQQRSSTTDTES